MDWIGIIKNRKQQKKASGVYFKRLSIVLLTALSVIPKLGYSQSVEMADQFRSSGKIYVVISVVLIILVGIGLYLWSIDKKSKKVEQELEEFKKGLQK